MACRRAGPMGTGKEKIRALMPSHTTLQHDTEAFKQACISGRMYDRKSMHIIPRVQMRVAKGTFEPMYSSISCLVGQY